MSNERAELIGANHAGRLQRPARVIFFGRDCPQSFIPLRHLLAAGIDVIAVAIWRHQSVRGPVHLKQQSGGALPLVNNPTTSLPGIATNHNIPVVEIGDLAHPATAELLVALEPDVFAVSCFPRLIPAALFAIPRLGAINLHPSLLPRLRGPDPLFWTFRFGLGSSGVTAHLMNDQFDAGSIIRSQSFTVPQGITGRELEHQVASIGGGLLVHAVLDLADGNAQYVAQNEEDSSYQSWPEASDLKIDISWEAGRAWSFVRGVLPLGYTPTIVINDQEYAIERPIGFSAKQNGSQSADIRDRVLTLVRGDGTAEFGVRSLDTHESASRSQVQDQ